MTKWIKRQAEPLPQELIDKFQLSPIQAKLFSLRKINTEDKLNFWLNATEDDLADPYLMHDMDKAVNRINEAIDNGEKITIYGDYDADGITATSIMVETLQILGADVHYFIPDRFKDGYGPNMERYQQIVADGTKLIITVDNGITGVDEIAYAKAKGVDTILTDHHTFQEKVPEAYAIVHCNYPGQKYPFDDYCGAGVAYTICRALMEDPMPELLELAMIGTIGDMVKVSGEGHIIVKRGLEMLNQTQRPGLLALIKQAGLKLGNINAIDIGFAIAPRLNAVGRLANAELAVELLLSDEEEQAQLLAKKVEDLNSKRKKLTEEVFNQALEQVHKFGYNKAKTLTLYNPNWHQGVLGLVANKIVEKTHKPTLLLTKTGDNKVSGSGRSMPGFNLFDALSPLKTNLLTQFGGHDFACGLSLNYENIDKLRIAFEASFKLDHNLNEKYYDIDLAPEQATIDFYQEIELVGPFGTDNPEPIFSLIEPKINKLSTMGKAKTHIRFDIGKLKVVGFNMAYLTDNLLPFVKRLYVKLSINEWQGRRSIQALLEDIKFGVPKLVVPVKVFDFRNEKHFLGFSDTYLLFNEKNADNLISLYNVEPSKIILADDYNKSDELVTLIDTPHSKKQLDQVLQKNNFRQLYLRFVLDQLPVTNIPNDQRFRDVLKYVYTHPNLEPKDYRLVAPHLGLDADTIYFILRVFLELNFVKMDDVRIVPNMSAPHHKLDDSQYFKAVKSQVDFVNSLRTMPSKRLIDYINRYM